MKHTNQQALPRKRSNTWKVAAFWAYVSLPLAWGVSATIQKAMALFA